MRTQLDYRETDTLSSIFFRRVQQSPDSTAYIQFNKATKNWDKFSWADMSADVSSIQAGLLARGHQQSHKMALMLSNCRQWIALDQAAQGLGIVTVPIYTNDRAENVGYILDDADITILVLENTHQFSQLDVISEQLSRLETIILVSAPASETSLPDNCITLENILNSEYKELISQDINPDDLATIVYTSGTTGRPKGVMLSHKNILANVHAGLGMVAVRETDRFLSFLPLSHMLERMTGYYLPIVTGSSVAFSRSIAQLANDLQSVRPTIMVSVPRIFERVFAKIQDKLRHEPDFKRRLFHLAVKLGWQRFQVQQKRLAWSPALLLFPLLDRLVGHKVRQQLGGELRFTVCGGAPLSDEIARFFIGLGIPILQGYGLTETSPVISVNTLEDNIPASVGLAMPGIEVEIGENDELLTRSDCVMLGYWNNQAATRQVIDENGWFHSGDKVAIEKGHIFITGRIKDIIVLGNGEKVPPADIELAISLLPMIDQVMIIGEGRAFLSALLVLEENYRQTYCSEHGILADEASLNADKKLNKLLLSSIRGALKDFPGYAKIRRIAICEEPWNTENGLLTPTLKMKRNLIADKHAALIENMYTGLAD